MKFLVKLQTTESFEIIDEDPESAIEQVMEAIRQEAETELPRIEVEREVICALTMDEDNDK